MADIDQAFRIIAEALRKVRVAGTICEYLTAIRNAWKQPDEENPNVHVEEVNSVLDYKAFVKDYVYAYAALRRHF